MGLTVKKKTMDATECNEEARAAWREQLKLLDARNLIMIDECSSNIGLTSLYGRSLKGKGQRAYGSAPRNRGKNTTLLAAFPLVEITRNWQDFTFYVIAWN